VTVENDNYDLDMVKPMHLFGIDFKSTLEARWALLFDALGLKWWYEPETFKLPGGVVYTPDFAIDAGYNMAFNSDQKGKKIWFEIKPAPMRKKHIDFCKKPLLMAQTIDEPFYYVFGQPIILYHTYVVNKEKLSAITTMRRPGDYDKRQFSFGYVPLSTYELLPAANVKEAYERVIDMFRLSHALFGVGNREREVFMPGINIGMSGEPDCIGPFYGKPEKKTLNKNVNELHDCNGGDFDCFVEEAINLGVYSIKFDAMPWQQRYGWGPKP
jgi:hypothetical protein